MAQHVAYLLSRIRTVDAYNITKRKLHFGKRMTLLRDKGPIHTHRERVRDLAGRVVANAIKSF